MDSSLNTAQVKPSPAVMEVAFTPEGRLMLTRLLPISPAPSPTADVDPMPNCPSALLPQQATSPVLYKTQVWSQPSAMEVTVASTGRSTSARPSPTSSAASPRKEVLPVPS